MSDAFKSIERGLKEALAYARGEDVDVAIHKVEGQGMAYRIYSPEDGETDVTPHDISDLPLKDQVEWIMLWFRACFEDPQNEMPYAEKDEPHNYRYLWGGPYDARDEIMGAFEELASEEAIEAAIEEAGRDGIIEWAPTFYHPERNAFEKEAMEEYYRDTEEMRPTLEEILGRLESGVVPSYGDPAERQKRESLRRVLAELHELVGRDSLQHGGIGHNRPPESDELAAEWEIRAAQAVDQMDKELAKDAPDAAIVADSAGKLQKILSWIARKLDKVADGIALGFGAVAVDGIMPSVREKISQAVGAVLDWLNTITLPF